MVSKEKIKELALQWEQDCLVFPVNTLAEVPDWVRPFLLEVFQDGVKTVLYELPLIFSKEEFHDIVDRTWDTFNNRNQFGTDMLFDGENSF